MHLLAGWIFAVALVIPNQWMSQVLATNHSSRSSDHEFELMERLLRGYNKDVRPTIRHSDVITVMLGVALTQLTNLDEKNQILTTNCWLNQMWLDKKLVWNPLDYGNITTIFIPMDKIWKPDILLYNNANLDYYHKVISTNGIVQFNGNVTWLVSSVFKSTCLLDVRHFPFDQQHCSMKFASWTYDGYQVDLNTVTTQGDISSYVPNGEWDLINMTAKRNLVIYSCCPEPYADVTITIVIRRLPLFYVAMYLLPCVGSTVFVLMGFYIPGECEEKVFLGIKALLSLILFLFMVGDSMPPTSSAMPTITLYYGASIFFVSLSTGFQVWTLNLHYRGSRGRKVPKFLRRLVIEGLGPWLCVNSKTVPRAVPECPTSSKPTPRIYANHVQIAESRRRGNNNNHIYRSIRNNLYAQASNCDQHFVLGEVDYKIYLEALQERLTSVLTAFCEKIEKSEQKLVKETGIEDVNNEWHKVAVIMDRFLFILFLCSNISVTSLIFMSILYS